MEKRKRLNRVGGALLLAALVFAGCGGNGGTEELPDTVTFTEHIAPLLYQHCYSCHLPGGSGHFSLATYAEAKARGSSLAFVTRERLMPPWPADAHYTQFVGQRVLSDHDIALIGKWVEEGMPEGLKDKLPPLPDPQALSPLGRPDLVLPVQPVFLKGNGGDQFLLVKVPFELPRDTFASLIEFVAGPANVVHHVNGDLVLYAPGARRTVFGGPLVTDLVTDSTIRQAYVKLGLPNDDGSYPALQRSVVNYLPGVFGQKYPQGIGGYRLPRQGAFLLNGMHYGNAQKDVTDSSYIRVYFTKVPPERPVKEFQLGTLGVAPVEPDLVVEANTVKSVVSRYRVPDDRSILTVNPHMHLIGKSFRAYAIPPGGGDTIRLISIPRWDFNWQYFYTFKKMVKIPAGSIMVAEGVYDNTRDNPANPFSPPQIIRDREGSMRATDEMFQFIVTYLPYKPGDENISLE